MINEAIKNELSVEIERITYNENKPDTDKIIGIYNISSEYLKNYKNLGVRTYSDMYFQLENGNTSDMYSESYEYLEEEGKEQEELKEKDYKKIIELYSRTGRKGGIVNEIDWLSCNLLNECEEAISDLKNNYINENEFFETIKDILNDVNKINNEISIEIKKQLQDLIENF